MVVLSVVSVVGKHTKQSLEPLPVALTPGSTYSASAGYLIPPASSGSGDFFPQGEFPNGVWFSPAAQCYPTGLSPIAISAAMQPYVDNGYSAMALSGSNAQACEWQGINLPASIQNGGTFTLSLDIKTEGPLSAGPQIWVKCFQSGGGVSLLPLSFSPQLNNIAHWTNFVSTVTVPSGGCTSGTQIGLQSGQTDGGPPAVNAYANIQMFLGQVP